MTQADTWKKIGILFLIMAGFCTTFLSGYILRGFLSVEPEQPTQTYPSPTPVRNIPHTTPTSEETTRFLPGKHHFDDTIILLTKDAPQQAVAATVSRTEQESGYRQNTAFSFFDGTSWKRKTDSQRTADSAIFTNPIVQSWRISTDPTRVLKQSIEGTLLTDRAEVNFSTGVLENEIGIRSLPGYTKFLSQGSGEIRINGVRHDAYVLYSRIYSLNAADIQFYTEPLDLTTDWLAFWDNEGNFYHIDSTQVGKPTPLYQSHKIAVREDQWRTVSKSFTFSITRGIETPPETFQYGVHFPDQTTIAVKRGTSFFKVPEGTSLWVMSLADIVVTKENGTTQTGTGILEYIRD